MFLRAYRTKSTKLISKQVQLDALGHGFEEEETIPSYLQPSNVTAELPDLSSSTNHPYSNP
ncbi:BZ3500_MvSof-1268-A1-R1_Chr8-1g09750 [Microbotryum saponariae]|uniref:BZ3500_MvSof-1268-A1-R1_Chr8-1g09750 protein n=1 Tax=Microbotryum saponariae TaxID=289078 RepID=A0A2X0KS27_9BASI|nr:BZ3500_MvSof-1268-A1-R1_Chr8-1g09750 [Microbotryum saponariae]SDA08036.1 BZ3501_MvSof-1269-A2-R1_Chr8-1g09473 [Microbotryum saponariae]